MTPQLFFGFDLDHTIGDFRFIDRYLDFFHLYKKTSDSLHNKLESAYKMFIEEVVKEIRNGNIKIFNPEILETINIMTPELESGLAVAMIYSNNSHWETLEFARDVIEEYVGSKVFCYMMHWGHELRKDEIVEGDPGNAVKTWDTFKKGFEEGCKESPFVPEQAVFYDDLIHEDIMRVIGPNNYKVVKPYYSKLNINSIGFIVLEALEASELDEDTEYFKILSELWNNQTLDPEFDTLYMMIDAIKREITKYDRSQFGGKGPSKRVCKRQTGSKRIKIKRQHKKKE